MDDRTDRSTPPADPARPTDPGRAAADGDRRPGPEFAGLSRGPADGDGGPAAGAPPLMEQIESQIAEAAREDYREDVSTIDACLNRVQEISLQVSLYTGIVTGPLTPPRFRHAVQSRLGRLDAELRAADMELDRALREWNARWVADGADPER